MFTKMATERLISLLQDGWVPEGVVELYQRNVDVRRTIDDSGRVVWKNDDEEIRPKAVKCPICSTVFRAAGDVRCPDCGILVVHGDNLVPEYDDELERMENMSEEEAAGIPTWEQFFKMIDECTLAQK